MANILTNNIEYNVKVHPEWFVGAMKSAYTLKSDYVRVLPNVTKDVYVKTLVGPGTVSQVDARDCEWTPTQRATIDGKTFTVANFKINEEQCLEELDSVYSEMVYDSIGATKDEWQSGEFGDLAGLETALMDNIQKGLALDVEKLIWGGQGNAVAGVQAGIVDDAAADSDVIKVTGTTLTSANIVSELEKVYNAIPEAVFETAERDEKAAVRIFMNPTAFRFLKQALSTVSTDYQVVMPLFAMDGGKIFYQGVEVCKAGLPANTMVAASRDNLIFATDLLSDTAVVRAEMGKELVNENKWFVKGAYRAKGGYIFGDEVVLYQ